MDTRSDNQALTSAYTIDGLIEKRGLSANKKFMEKLPDNIRVEGTRHGYCIFRVIVNSDSGNECSRSPEYADIERL